MLPLSWCDLSIFKQPQLMVFFSLKKIFFKLFLDPSWFIEFFQFYSPAQLFSFVGMLVGVVCHWKVGNYIKEGGECGWRVCATFTYNESHFKICTGLTLFAVY